MSLFRIVTLGAVGLLCSVGLVLVLVGGVAVGGCGSNIEKRACMKMGGTDLLVSGAVLLRLDVYGAGVRCDGASVVAGTGAPVMSHTYQKGQAITLEVPPGPHTLVLTTYADGGGTMVLGQGCTQATLTPGAQICFALSLSPPADLSMIVAPPDLAGADLVMPSSGCTGNADCADAGTASVCDTTQHKCIQCVHNGDCPTGQSCTNNVCTVACDLAAGLGCATGRTCCNKQCVDTTVNVANCGGCGNACDQTNSFGAQCVGASCVYTSCRSGWANCVTTPPDRDGCETHTDVDVDNCGGCGRDCKSANVAARHCSAGLCDSTCNSGSANCSEPTAPTVDNACETNAFTPAHCGTSSPAACTNVCSYANATALCPAGTCLMGACSPGNYDCNQMTSDGCEAPGPASAPGCCTGTSATAHGTKQINHTDGLGQTWFDCEPLATYTMAEAQAAAAAFDSTGAVDAANNHFSDAKGTVDYICNASATKMSCPCWAWQATGMYALATGHVDQHTPGSSSNCFFPLSDSGFTAWQ